MADKYSTGSAGDTARASGDVLNQLREAGRGTLIERMGIELVEASAQRTVGTLPVAGNTQPQGLLHGGAAGALAETLGSYAAAIHPGQGQTADGVEVSAPPHRPERE